MATYARALVSLYRAADLPADWITNTVHFKNVLPGIVAPVDWQSFAQNVWDAFEQWRQPPAGYNRLNVKLYNMEDSTPRPIMAQVNDALTPSSSASMPREVALCLSYYAERNLPRNRGRLYLGPWDSDQERPSTTKINSVLALKDQLADAGGVDWQWCVFSATTPGGFDDQFKQVSAGWVDNEWDTVRSRGLKATLRNPWTKEG